MVEDPPAPCTKKSLELGRGINLIGYKKSLDAKGSRIRQASNKAWHSPF